MKRCTSACRLENYDCEKGGKKTSKFEYEKVLSNAKCTRTTEIENVKMCSSHFCIVIVICMSRVTRNCLLGNFLRYTRHCVPKYSWYQHMLKVSSLDRGEMLLRKIFGWIMTL